MVIKVLGDYDNFIFKNWKNKLGSNVYYDLYDIKKKLDIDENIFYVENGRSFFVIVGMEYIRILFFYLLCRC